MFNHVPVKVPKLETKTINHKRFYVTPEGNYYPSITTVLSIRKKEGLTEWRKRVGNDVANYVAGKAARRGTTVHHMCEDYLNNQHCIAKYKGTPSVIDFKTSTKERSDEWNENYYIQGAAYSEMFLERTGHNLPQVVILVVTEDGTVQEFIKNKYNYLDDLSEAIEEWSKQNV